MSGLLLLILLLPSYSTDCSHSLPQFLFDWGLWDILCSVWCSLISIGFIVIYQQRSSLSWRVLSGWTILSSMNFYLWVFRKVSFLMSGRIFEGNQVWKWTFSSCLSSMIRILNLALASVLCRLVSRQNPLTLSFMIQVCPPSSHKIVFQIHICINLRSNFVGY